MKRIIYYLLLVIALCFVSEVKAQNNYAKFDFGCDLSINDNMGCVNKTLNVGVGHFFTDNVAFELDCGYGIKNYGYDYFRIGINYLYECSTSYYVAPYFKSGVGYRGYYTDYENCHGVEFKLGFGTNVYISDKIALVIGMDFSIIDLQQLNENITLFTPKIGLSYNF